MLYHFNTRLHSGGSGKYFDLLQKIRDDQIFIGIGEISVKNIFRFLFDNIKFSRNENHVKIFHSQLTLFLLFWFCRGPVFFIPHGIVNGAVFQWKIRNAVQFVILRYSTIEVIGCGSEEYANLLLLLGQKGKKRAQLLRNPAIPLLERSIITGNRFLFCGPAIPQKGIDRFFKLVPRCYQHRCDIISNFAIDTKYAKKSELMLQQSRMTNLGLQKITPLLLSNYKALVVCSTFEGLPFLVLEALSNGLPVILPNVPGCAELADCVGVICYDLHQRDLSNELKMVEQMPKIRQHDINKFEKIYSIKTFNAFWSSIG
jgi:glycosyltransferase involved in cell wall biosynthesis